MASMACWTCRLRKKKCDRDHPVCKSCASLDISCFYSKERPEWMDGGEKQTAKTQAIKARVRQGVTARRGNDVAVRVFSLYNDQQTESTPTAVPEISRTNSGSAQTSAGSVAAPADESPLDETENFLITLYLDTVFPLLFPLYEPTTLSGGRSWIPALLKGNKAVFHSALSLSAYYFTLLLAKDASHTLRTPCEQHVWDTLAKHMEMSIIVIKQDMDQYHLERNNSDVSPKLHVLGGVVQYLIFATAMPQGADWKIHLSAALTLLYEILESHGGSNGEYSLENTVRAMDKPSIFDGIHLGFAIWNNDQAAFQFFTSFLFYADTIASIQLGRPSQLQHHHKSLIANREASTVPDGQAQQLLGLESYIGCPGWVLTTLSEISTMEITKRSAQHKGDNYLKEFMEKGCELQTKLQVAMREIDASIQSGFLITQLDSIRLGDQINEPQAEKRALITKAWLHAAIIYLSVVVDGWQPSNPFIRDNVNNIMSILNILLPQLSIRSLMWPLCISGFLARPEQEQVFKRILSAPGPLQALGSGRQALQLMQQVWELRDGLNESSWGIYNCFQMLGSEVLFI
ncbi:hypothetical protein ACHAQJ_005328 [Trichoderma viride]